MSPFKEPQPRKNSVEKDGEKVIGGVWPPYSRLGSEARWEETGQKPLTEEWPDETPVPSEDARKRVREWADARADLEVRKAALEAAVRYFAGVNRTGDKTLELAVKFEEYLRNGKPS